MLSAYGVNNNLSWTQLYLSSFLAPEGDKGLSTLKAGEPVKSI